MRKSRFSEEQIIKVLKEKEAGGKLADVCRRHGISEPTLASAGTAGADAHLVAGIRRAAAASSSAPPTT